MENNKSASRLSNILSWVLIGLGLQLIVAAVLSLFRGAFVLSMGFIAVSGMSLVSGLIMRATNIKKAEAGQVQGDLMVVDEAGTPIAAADAAGTSARDFPKIEKTVTYGLTAVASIFTIAFLAVLMQGLVVLAAALVGFVLGVMIAAWVVFRYCAAKMK